MAPRARRPANPERPAHPQVPLVRGRGRRPRRRPLSGPRAVSLVQRESPTRSLRARRLPEVSGRRGRASSGVCSVVRASPRVRRLGGRGLEAPVPVSGRKAQIPTASLTKDRTSPGTLSYHGMGATPAYEPPGAGTGEDAREEPGAKGGVKTEPKPLPPLGGAGRRAGGPPPPAAASARAKPHDR